MASEEQVERIRGLASDGRSVNEIRDRLGIPKSTVYYHFKKEVGQKQKENQPKIPDDDDFRGELCGIFAGDGGFHHNPEKGHYRVRFHLNHNLRYWEILADYLEKRLGKEPNIYEYPEDSKTVLNYTSKKIYRFLENSLHWSEDKTSSIRLKEEKCFSREFRKGFLRGLIDTDGYRREDHRRYVFTSISPGLVADISRSLEKLGIEHTRFEEKDDRRNHRNRHKVRITGEDTKVFQKKVSPRHPKRQYRNLVKQSQNNG